MRTVTAAMIIAAAFASFGTMAPVMAADTCVTKTASGTGTSKDIAMFEAWEAVLQATDWGMWTQMMTTKWEVGYAPGMKVSNLHSSCNAGGMGTNCVIQAKLCRK